MNSAQTSQGEGRVVAGVDVGGTKIAVIIADRAGSQLAKVVAPTRLDSIDHTLAAIVDAIHQGLQEAGISADRLAAVGIGIPGRVDTVSGIVQQAVNLHWSRVPAGEILSAQLGVPCALENDVRLAALGLQRNGRMDGSTESMAYVSVGTGIAAGLIIEGKLYRGAHGMAGEIGHALIEPGGPRCACGLHGCLEALAAGPAIARMAEEAVSAGSTGLLKHGATPADVYRAAAQGDTDAREIVDRAGRWLAVALQQLIMMYDVESVVLGGGVSRAGEAFLEPILAALEELRAQSPLAREMIKPGMITLLDPTYDAGAWGGVALAEDALRSKEEEQP